MAKIGTNRHPAIVRVQTEEKGRELVNFCSERGIQVIVGIEADKPEDISDIERALRSLQPVKVKSVAPPHISGNDYCPCGSGKKYKKCCAGAAPVA